MKRSTTPRHRPSKPQPSARAVLARLASLADPRVRAAMRRFGVLAKKAHGISAPVLHRLAREIGTSHELAGQLWESGVHEARLLATMIGDPARVSAAQMERWARDFDSWDVVDGACCHLFVRAAPAWDKAQQWPHRKEEFVRRSGFALMAFLAVHDKQAPDAKFARLLPLIRRYSTDERNFVKKAVNWALRQIGKRNLTLNHLAIRTAKQIRSMDSRTVRWIAADALRELTSPALQKRLRKKPKAVLRHSK